MVALFRSMTIVVLDFLECALHHFGTHETSPVVTSFPVSTICAAVRQQMVLQRNPGRVHVARLIFFFPGVLVELDLWGVNFQVRVVELHGLIRVGASQAWLECRQRVRVDESSTTSTGAQRV